MAIKDIYKEVENEKKNEVKPKVVTMDIDDFIEEHKKLVKLLRTGTKAQLLAEADEQEKELSEYEDDDDDDKEDM